MAGEEKKLIPKLVYGGVGLAGLITIAGLLMMPGIGLSQPLMWLLGISALAWGTTKFMKKDYTETILYLGIFAAGLMTAWGLIGQPNLGISMTNAVTWLLAVGAIAWGALKFGKIDIVKMVSVA